MTLRAWGMLFVALLVGCTNLNYQKVWRSPPPTETLTPAGTELRIADARPKWERKPFRGAMSLYAVSDITPSPWEQLRVAIATVADEPADRPESVEVVVRSVQLVVKDSNRLAQEAENRHVFQSGPDDDDAGFSQILFSVLIGIPLELILNAPLEKRYPSALWQSPDGASCRFRADVTITWPGGRKKSIPVSGLATADSGESSEPRDALNESVRLVMFQVQDQLRGGLGVARLPDASAGK